VEGFLSLHRYTDSFPATPFRASSSPRQGRSAHGVWSRESVAIFGVVVRCFCTFVHVFLTRGLEPGAVVANECCAVSATYPIRLRAFISSYILFPSPLNRTSFGLHTTSFSSLTVEISKVYSTPSLSLPLRLEPLRACTERLCCAPSQQAVEGERKSRMERERTSPTHIYNSASAATGPMVANAGEW
jgi:hypothetical protein